MLKTNVMYFNIYVSENKKVDLPIKAISLHELYIVSKHKSEVSKHGDMGT